MENLAELMIAHGVRFFKRSILASQLRQFPDKELLFEPYLQERDNGVGRHTVATVIRVTASSAKRPSRCSFMIFRTRAIGRGCSTEMLAFDNGGFDGETRLGVGGSAGSASVVGGEWGA